MEGLLPGRRRKTETREDVEEETPDTGRMGTGPRYNKELETDENR